MQLEPYLDPKNALVLPDCGSLDELMQRLAAHAAPAVGGLDAPALMAALLEREQRHPTSTPEGVAFPHAMLNEIEETHVVIALVRPAVDFGVKGHPKADLVFCMFGHAGDPVRHVRLLARQARIANSPGALERLRHAKTPEELHAQLVDEDRAHG